MSQNFNMDKLSAAYVIATGAAAAIEGGSASRRYAVVPNQQAPSHRPTKATTPKHKARRKNRLARKARRTNRK